MENKLTATDSMNITGDRAEILAFISSIPGATPLNDYEITPPFRHVFFDGYTLNFWTEGSESRDPVDPMITFDEFKKLFKE